jgi:paraquat-inducible protein A
MMQRLIACHECDLLHRLQPLPQWSKARCSRCGALLYVHAPHTIDQTFALSITGLMLLIIANLYPFLSLESQGTILETTLITGTIILSQQKMASVALLVLLTSMLVPLALLSSLVYVLWAASTSRRLPMMRRIFRMALALRPWSMTEIFILGILVSVFKLAKMASIIPGIALFAFLALVFVLAAISASLDSRAVWEKMDRQSWTT